jgi:hypothetical protein
LIIEGNCNGEGGLDIIHKEDWSCWIVEIDNDGSCRNLLDTDADTAEKDEHLDIARCFFEGTDNCNDLLLIDEQNCEHVDWELLEE